jgi:uncharacterized protein YaaR (DUF327 family)
MANVAFPDSASPLFNPAAYGEASAGAQKTKTPQKTGKAKRRPFASLFDKARETEEPQDLPVSQESLNLLLDSVHNAGEALSRRPFPEEIKAYKQAVRNFVHYVVENTFDTEEQTSGILKRNKHTLIQERKKFTLVQVIDKKLEELASAILRGQSDQLAILERTDEIRGLLVDLME